MPRYKIAPLRTRSGEVRMGLRHADSGQFADEEAAGQAPVDASAFDDPEPSLADEAAELGVRLAEVGARDAGRLEAEVTELGRRIAERAEEIAGVRAEEIGESIRQRASDAQQWIEGVYRPRVEAQRPVRREMAARYHERVSAGFDREEEWARYQEGIRELDAGYGAEYWARQAEALGHPGAAEREQLDRLRDATLEAIAEVRDMGGEHSNWAKGSTAKARAAFQAASAFYPRDWVEASDAAGEMMARAQKSRAHYRHGTAERAFRERHQLLRGGAFSYGEERPDDSLLRHGPRPSRQAWEFGGRRVSRQAGTGWAQVEGTWQEVIHEGPVEEHLRGVVYVADGAPKGEGWTWHPFPGRDGLGHWSRPVVERVEVGGVAEIKTSSVAHDAVPTAVHELAHRAEYTVPGIAALEHAFLERRWREAGVEGQAPKRLYPGTRGNREVARDAGFANPYVGKIYSDSGSGRRHDIEGRYATEVMSMGMEAIFGGKHGSLLGADRAPADHDHRAFVLGVLATAGRR